ncbi:inturned planar cell polarity protein isoform X2 [Rhodnius prolixus]|uniref:inturned planar cell polarity protein isoform X2 n=1 Tax=Rhodnius prolixus TaxID=13249 RepID=UPI003D189CEC
MELDKRRNWYYYSESESSSEERYVNEWENNVNADGSVFFVKKHPQTEPFMEDIELNRDGSNQGNQSDKSTGIFGRFIRRRSSRRTFRRKDSKLSKDEATFNTDVKFAKVKDGEELETDSKFVRIRLDEVSMRQTSLESLFGLKTVVHNFSILVVGFLPTRASLFVPKVKLGDKLYSINGITVTPLNAEEILLGLSTCKEVLLEFRSKKECLEGKESILTSSKCTEKGYFAMNGSVLYAKFEGLSEAGPADQGIIYCFPKEENILSQIRGIFFTLSHLLSTVSSTPPKSTTIKLNNDYINVLYVHEKNELLLIALPDSKYFLNESTRIVTSIARCLEFMFQSLNRCFSTKHNAVFLDTFFYKLFSNTKGKTIDNETKWEFETLLPSAISVCLPKEIYIQIDDALNELESNFLPSQGFLICNHLPIKDLLDITALMKENDILQLCKEGIKEFMYWREVYPLSCQRGLALQSSAPYSTPLGRWFLLIVGTGHCFLATLYEASRCTTRIPMVTAPNAAYIAEAQATLSHIIKTEFPIFFNKQLNINPEFIEEMKGQTKTASTDSSSSLSSHAELQIQSNSCINERLKSHSLSTFKGRLSAETTRTLSSYSDVSYAPEEELVPVLGRRAERELALETNSQSRISVSDISDDSDWLKESKSNKAYGTDINDINKTLFPEDFIAYPRVSTEEENVLIHFVSFEASEGVLICSTARTDTSRKYLHILQTFRQHAHKIQKIFLNTVLFKKLKSQETAEILNKSLVAVNEYGTLFQYIDESKKEVIETYWVVGKLFFMPHPKEIYVCYLDKYPQSMVEIGFQLALSGLR